MHELIINIGNFFQSFGAAGLALNAAIESCLPGFPLPPDFLLIAMSLTLPQKALFYALICTIGSVSGGLIGYLIGRYGGRPLFNKLFASKSDKFKAVENLYEQYGSLAVFFSAFSPIPYNIFTIASGILKMNPLKFTLVSCLGRGGRFFLVSTVLMLFGETIKEYLNYVILGVSLLLVIFFIVVYKKRHSFIKAENMNITKKDNIQIKESEKTEQTICQ
jgi:undecaprenyl-diphosphatase